MRSKNANWKVRIITENIYCIEKYRLNYIDEITNLTKEQLLQMKHMNMETVKEILDKIEENGVGKSIENNKTGYLFIHYISKQCLDVTKLQVLFKIKNGELVSDINVKELPFSSYMINVLINHGYKTAKQILLADYVDIKNLETLIR